MDCSRGKTVRVCRKEFIEKADVLMNKCGIQKIENKKLALFELMKFRFILKSYLKISVNWLKSGQEDYGLDSLETSKKSSSYKF